MVEATEFPHLVHRHGITGVPKTVANEFTAAEGAMPEQVVAANLLALSESGRRS